MPESVRCAELGIDVVHIVRKTRSMLRPFRADASLCDDGDLTGPLLFALLLGSCQLLVRACRQRARLGLVAPLNVASLPQMCKIHFGIILGWSVLTMLALHWLFNMLAGPSGVRRLQRASLLAASCVTRPVVCTRASSCTAAARCWAIACCLWCCFQR